MMSADTTDNGDGEKEGPVSSRVRQLKSIRAAKKVNIGENGRTFLTTSFGTARVTEKAEGISANQHPGKNIGLLNVVQSILRHEAANLRELLSRKGAAKPGRVRKPGRNGQKRERSPLCFEVYLKREECKCPRL